VIEWFVAAAARLGYLVLRRSPRPATDQSSTAGS